jgi:hypothetical protein
VVSRYRSEGRSRAVGTDVAPLAQLAEKPLAQSRGPTHVYGHFAHDFLGGAWVNP